MSPKPLKIGVMLEAIQMSDIVGMDIIGSLSTAYINATIPFGTPPAVVEQAIDMTFYYIATTLDVVYMTPSFPFVPNTTYDTCPRDLDILLIGGPSPAHRPAAADKFLKESVEKTEVVMSVCTGGLWLAHSGVLNGRKATTNREFLGYGKEKHPEVEWKDERWVVDGKFWTAGGAGCGIDMVADFVKQRFGKDIVAFVLRSLQFEHGKGKKYE